MASGRIFRRSCPEISVNTKDRKSSMESAHMVVAPSDVRPLELF